MTKFAKGERSEKNGEELSGLDFVPEGLLPAMLYSLARRTKRCQHNQYRANLEIKERKFLNLKSARSAVFTVYIVYF